MKIKNYLLITIFAISTILLLILATKGTGGNPIYYQSPETRNTKVGGPFESSGSTSRYALTEAIAEDNTFFLNENRARFSAPDMVQYKGKFFSIFTPGISFVGVPFYIIGKTIGLTQLFTYSSTILFALLNVFLISKLAGKFGAGQYASILSGFIFLFATDALSYSLTYTQHHASTAIILLALLNAFGNRTAFKNLWFGILVGIGLLFDIPNIFMMAPIGIYILTKHFQITKDKNKIKLSIKISIISLIIGMIPFLAIFGWYNKQLTGSYTKIGQTIGRSDYFDPPEVKQKRKQEKQENSTTGLQLPFNTRKQMNELYILLISNQRGWIYYSPIVIIGMLGLFVGYKKRQNKNIVTVAVAVVLITIISYSLFSGLGGWAFGPRYLIPATAILSAGIGLAVHKFKKNFFFLTTFILLSSYSIGVNVLGAMTTTQIPPKVEAVNLADPIPYTYKYNLQLMEQNENSSLIYNMFLSNDFKSIDFIYAYFSIVLLIVVSLYTATLSNKPTQTN